MEQNMEPIVEKKQNKKKVIIIVGVVAGLLVVAAAAFMAGRLLNQRLAPASLVFMGGGEGSIVSGSSVEFSPAPELPTTAPEVTGFYAERQDNIIYVQTFSLETGGGGIVVSSSSETSEDGSTIVSSNGNEGPKVEVVITNDTKIYKDVTPMTMNPGEETTKVQQEVELSNLDDITTQTMLTVWGRRVGDRVIADVVFYSNPVFFTAP